MRRIAIIGAGPIGLEAAHYGRRLGYDVQVYEKGAVADHIRRWGHVRMFSPFGINHSALGAGVVLGEEVGSIPKDEELLTGEQYRRRYLLPLAESMGLQGRIHEHSEVVAIGRQGLFKGEMIGQDARLASSFRLLIVNAAGGERHEEADLVLDCSGVYSRPNWAGDGGIPAMGERSLRADGRVTYHIPDVLGVSRVTYRRKHTVVVGGGSSAATSLGALMKLAEEEPGTTVTWVLRTTDEPLPLIEGDPLPERSNVYRRANELYTGGHPALRILAGARVLGFEASEADVVVRVGTPEGEEKVRADRIVANVGYQPDNRLYEELQVHECYASRGPMKLAAALLAAGASTADCMAQSSPGPETLQNPEPGFFILGAKSYGKNSQFLIRLGLEQIRDVYRLVTGNDALDLYEPASG